MGYRIKRKLAAKEAAEKVCCSLSPFCLSQTDAVSLCKQADVNIALNADENPSVASNLVS